MINNRANLSPSRTRLNIERGLGGGRGSICPGDGESKSGAGFPVWGRSAEAHRRHASIRNISAWCDGDGLCRWSPCLGGVLVCAHRDVPDGLAIHMRMRERGEGEEGEVRVLALPGGSMPSGLSPCPALDPTLPSLPRKHMARPLLPRVQRPVTPHRKATSSKHEAPIPYPRSFRLE